MEIFFLQEQAQLLEKLEYIEVILENVSLLVI